MRFLQAYAEDNAILLPGRIPGYKRDDIQLLPSSTTKKVVNIMYSECVFVYVCVCVRTYECGSSDYVCVCVCVHMCTHVHTHTCTHSYVCTHTHTHTHTCIHTHVPDVP